MEIRTEKFNTNFENSLINKKNKSKNSVLSFKGLTVEERNDGSKYHTFYIPGPDDLRLEVIPLTMDEKGDYHEAGEKQQLKPEKNNGFLKIWTPSDKNSILNIENPKIKLGYRFFSGKIPILDNVRQVLVNEETYNLAWDPERPNLKKGRQIYHLMPDMLKPEGPDRRNHFNVFGGKIEDIINKLDYIKDMGATRVLSTPILNNGPKNSNNYWVKNPFQDDPIRGTKTDFCNLGIELFKRGMGYIMDGAFVNESWEGIHLKDVMKYGKKSPFFHMFIISDKDQKLRPELLPDAGNKEAVKNLGIKIINGPYKLNYEPGKDPTVEKIASYNDNLPTKIQIFDKRFASEKQQNDYKKLIQTYDIKNLDDPNEVKRFSDSVQTASFNVSPQSIEHILEGKETIKPLDLIKNPDWDYNFVLAFPGEGSNASPWDGQKDIMKLRFFTTDAEERKLKYTNRAEDAEKLIGIKKGASMVQDNVVQVGEFWTGEIEKTLSEYTAKKLSENLSKKGYTENLPTDKKAELIKQSIDELSKPGVNGQPPAIPKETSSLINEEQIKNLLESKYNPEKGSYEGKYNLPAAPLPRNITEGIMFYPLESIDFPDEICSILASPHVKKLAHKLDLINVSRYDLFMNPEEYDNPEISPIYKKMDSVYLKKITPLVEEVIKSSPKLEQKMLSSGGELTPEGSEIFHVVGGDILKYIVVKSLANTEPTEDTLQNGKPLEYDKDELYVNSFVNRLHRSEKGHEEEAESLVDSISDGLVRITEADKRKLSDYIEKRSEGLNEDTLKTSKLILNKTESGLEWRIDAARDVADMTTIKAETAEGKARIQNTFNESWDKVCDFWGRFINGVKKHNSKYYAIGESSNLHKAYPTDPNVPGHDLSRGNYPTLGSLERKFIEKTKFTTPTNYTYLFSALPNLVHSALDTEYEEWTGDFAAYLKGKLLDGWLKGKRGESPGYLMSGPVDQILYSHVGINNHDTFRAVHGLSLDINNYTNWKWGLFNPTSDMMNRWKGYKIGAKFNELNKLNEIIETKPNGIDIEDAEYDAKKIREMDSAGITMADTIMQCYELTSKEVGIEPEKKQKFDDLIKKSVDNLATGTFKGKEYNDLPEHFGKRAIHHNWQDITAEAKYLDKEFMSQIPQEKLDKIGDKIHEKFIDPGMKKYKAIELYKQVFPGCPTNYNGEELGETGFESNGKNVYLYCRNRLHFNWLNEKPFVKKHNEELKKIMNLRNRKEMSPLVNGQTIVLKDLKNNDKTQNKRLFGLYRYNKDRDVIAVLNNAGFANTRSACNVIPQTIPFIDTQPDKIKLESGVFDVGIPGGLKDGTVYINAFNKDDKYITKEGKIYSQNNENITIKDPALILYREKSFKEVP